MASQTATGVACWICLEEGPNDDGEPLTRGCACRGESGFCHVACIAAFARRKVGTAMAEMERTHEWSPDFYHPWKICNCCKQRYQGGVACALAEACVTSTQHLLETNYERLAAKECLIEARYINDQNDGLEVMCRQLLELMEPAQPVTAVDQERSFFDLPRSIRMELAKDIFFLLAKVLQKEERYEEATNVLERIRDRGGESTFLVDQMIAEMKRDMGCGADTRDDVERLRENLDQGRRRLGEENSAVLNCKHSFVQALFNDGQFTEAVKLNEEIVETAERVLGKDHQATETYRYTLNVLKPRQQHLREAVLTGFVRNAKMNGRHCAINKLVRDGKYIVSVFSGGDEPKRFKVVPSNLIYAERTPVTCKGLKTAQNLNGRAGTICSFNETKMRYIVEFQEVDGDSSKRALVKTENLDILFP